MTLEWSSSYHMQAFLPDDQEIPMPEVAEWLMWIWRAFHRLSVDRPWYGGGMSSPVPGPIPWRLTTDYGVYHDYNTEEIELMDQCIRAMDSVFITSHQAKMKGASK